MDGIDWLDLANRQYVSRYEPSERYRNPSRLGTPLRAARRRAHKRFDLIWQRRYMTRAEAYAWLAVQMGMPQDDCHMGMMTREECAKVEALAKDYLAKRKIANELARRDTVRAICNGPTRT